MPRKFRTPKEKFKEISDEELFLLSDGLLGAAPEKMSFKQFLLEDDGEAIRQLWNEHRDAILREWVRAHPGTRPSIWWNFDGPRMTREDQELHGWLGAFFADRLCDPRKRLAGVGIPSHEVFCYVPTFPLGCPDSFVDVDPSNPPKFESQSSYLKRHALFSPGEEGRLKLADFEPEIIQPETDDDIIQPEVSGTVR